jgi:hypothetical protein
VSLNLKKPEAIELARELIAKCDVVAENFGPGVMHQLGLGYAELCQVKPDIVLFSMPAAGLTGPLRDVRTYGLSLTSTTGLDSLTGYDDGPPIPMENAFSDPFNGIMGAFAILTALHHRDRTGKGQHIDYSQQEAVMQMVGPAFMDYAMNGRVAGPMGNRHPLAAAAPHGVFPCAGDDRWISIAVGDESEWRGLVTAMNDAEWARASEFSTIDERVRNIHALHERLAAWTAGFDDRAPRRGGRSRPERGRPAPRPPLPRPRHLHRGASSAGIRRNHLRRLRQDQSQRGAGPHRTDHRPGQRARVQGAAGDARGALPPARRGAGDLLIPTPPPSGPSRSGKLFRSAAIAQIPRRRAAIAGA